MPLDLPYPCNPQLCKNWHAASLHCHALLQHHDDGVAMQPICTHLQNLSCDSVVLQVIDDEICFKWSEYENCFQLFQSRAQMHRSVYTHRWACIQLDYGPEWLLRAFSICHLLSTHGFAHVAHCWNSRMSSIRLSVMLMTVQAH